ncbi:MAG: hypothetical protein FWD65_03320 [Coriobacteriia bacterium]|nr:hypothetical protein [Coriobacteriia bacterium]
MAKYARIDFRRKSPYDHLGGWLLALTLFFALDAIGSLASVGIQLASGKGLDFGEFLVLVFFGWLVFSIMAKNKKYRIPYYCWVIFQALMAVVVLLAALLTPPFHTPISFMDKPIGTITSMEAAIATFVLVGVFVGIGFYFHKSKRVSAYFGSKSA